MILIAVVILHDRTIQFKFYHFTTSMFVLT